MLQIFKKQISLLLVSILLLSFIVPVFAAENDEPNGETYDESLGYSENVATPTNVTVSSNDYFAGGAGTFDEPYQIETAEQLANLSRLVNEGIGDYNLAHYKLMNDIDLSAYSSGSGWVAIGWHDSVNKIDYFFKGVFDGDGHSIRNMRINQPQKGRQGLFGHVNDGDISNLNIVDCNITGGWSVGAMVGTLSGNGTVMDCSSSGIIKGVSSIGGIVGNVFDNGSIYNSHNNGTVIGVNYVGGVVGDFSGGMLAGCYNLGKVEGTGEHIGGYVGYNYNDTAGIYNQGRIGIRALNDISVRSVTYGDPVASIQITNRNPAHNATNVAVNNSIEVAFNSWIYWALDGGIRLREFSNDQIVPININWQENVLSIAPTANLKANTQYYIEITDSAISDFYFMYFGGLTKGAYTFTTGSSAAPTITTDTLVPATVGQAYSQTVAATGVAPITWSGTLPPGLTINQTTGVISGTPTRAGNWGISVRATNANGTTVKIYTLTVNAGATAPFINSVTGPTTVGYSYSSQLTATGSTPITWGILSGSLPPGLNLNTGTGLISGTTTAAGTFTFTVRATNSVGNHTREMRIIVAQASPGGGGGTINIDGYFGGSRWREITSVASNVPSGERQSFVNTLLTSINPTTVQRDLVFNLLFNATHRPNNFGGTTRWPYPNNSQGTLYNSVRDPGLFPSSPNTNIRFSSSMGCASYARFGRAYIYNLQNGTSAGIRADAPFSASNVSSVRTTLNSRIAFGDTLHYWRTGTGEHEVLYLAEKQGGAGFYCLDFGGGASDPIRLLYLSYQDFANEVDRYKILKPSNGVLAVNVQYTHLRISCPVDVSVVYDGEELNSATGKLVTSFGAMIVDGPPDDRKIEISLDYGLDYDFSIVGNAAGTMDFTVEYNDETGIADSHQFSGIPVTSATNVNVYDFFAYGDLELYVENNGNVNAIWLSTLDDGVVTAPNQTLLDTHLYFSGANGGSPIVPPILDRDNNRDSSSSSGSSVTTSAAAAPQEQWANANVFNSLVQAANRNGQNFVRTSHNGRFGIRAATWQTLAGKRYEHDTMDGRNVQVRLYIDNPAAMTVDRFVSAWIQGNDVNRTRTFFERWFNNKMQVVYFDQSGDWGQTVRVAAKVDLTGMNTQNLVFYAYDRERNAYRQIRQPNYRIDANGYLIFCTDLAGAIIVSDGAFVRK